MKRTTVSACVFVVAASLAGCGATGDVEYSGEVRVTSPELVAISPGVQVVEDADEPLFYADNNYWLYRDSTWYRSDSYRGGFARVDYTYVPSEIRTIDRPQVYVQYRRNMGRNNHNDRDYARDRRPQERTQQYQQPTYQQPQPYQQPAQPVQPTYQQPHQQPYQQTTTPFTPAQKGEAHPTPRPDGVNPTQPAQPPAVRPNAPAQTPDDHRREPDRQRNAPADVDHSIHTPAVTPTPPAHDDRDEHRDDHGRDERANNHDDRNTQNPGNPSAPSRIAPSNTPASPNPAGAAKDADKDRHDHGDDGRANNGNGNGHGPAAKDNRDKKKNDK